MMGREEGLAESVKWKTEDGWRIKVCKRGPRRGNYRYFNEQVDWDICYLWR